LSSDVALILAGCALASGLVTENNVKKSRLSTAVDGEQQSAGKRLAHHVCKCRCGHTPPLARIYAALLLHSPGHRRENAGPRFSFLTDTPEGRCRRLDGENPSG